MRKLYSLFIYLLTPLALLYLAFRGLRSRDYLKRWPTTGCFRKGRPITDPETGKVLGYEMEQVAFG